MSGRPPVTGAFEAYRRERATSSSPRSEARPRSRPRPSSEPRRATPVTTRRSAPGRGGHTAARPNRPTRSDRAAHRSREPRPLGPREQARLERDRLARSGRGSGGRSDHDRDQSEARRQPRGSVTGAARRHPSARRPSPHATARPPAPHVVRRRVAVIPVLSILLFAAVAAKLVDVQVRNPDRYLAQGAAQRVTSTTLAAGRGAIYDRNGEALALSVPRRTVFVDPSMVDDAEGLARQLAPILRVPRARLVELMSGEGRFAVLARTVEDRVADRVEALDEDALGTIQEFDRVNPADDLARSILGQVTADGADGISGLELQFDDDLTGTAGSVTYERARVEGGGTITGTRRSVEPARPGADVTLTLDQPLQYEAEQSLAEHLARAGARGGTVVVSRPSTGEILALANLALDDGGTGYVPTAANTALTDVYEPGSVNKIVTVAAAIEEGIVTPDTVLDVPDTLQVGDHVFSDSHPHDTTPWSVTDILATSSNVGTIMLAQQLGSRRMDEYLRRFGFGRTSGLDFPDESAGLMIDPEQWDQQSTAIGSIPIGQGMAVTAVQMLEAFNVLANDGTYVPARLVREVTRPDGSSIDLPERDPWRVVSPETARAVRAMMAQVVERGTGQLAAVPGYSVAGKTGTARKPQPTGTYEDENGDMHYIATFGGLLPAENPDLSIIVVIDEPDPDLSIYAADVAAPAFADLARVALRRFGIPPSVGGEVIDVPEMSESAQEIGDAPIQGTPRRDGETPASADGAVADDGGGGGEG